MFQLVSSFSPWAYVHISSTCKEIQRNLAFLWTQNGNPKQLYNLDICLFRLQLSYLGFSLNKTRNHSHPQEGINSVILMLVLRTTEGPRGNLWLQCSIKQKPLEYRPELHSKIVKADHSADIICLLHWTKQTTYRKESMKSCSENLCHNTQKGHKLRLHSKC